MRIYGLEAPKVKFLPTSASSRALQRGECTHQELERLMGKPLKWGGIVGDRRQHTAFRCRHNVLFCERERAERGLGRRGRRGVARRTVIGMRGRIWGGGSRRDHVNSECSRLDRTGLELHLLVTPRRVWRGHMEIGLRRARLGRDSRREPDVSDVVGPSIPE